MFAKVFNRTTDTPVEAQDRAGIDDFEADDVPMPMEMMGIDLEHEMEQDELDDLDHIELPPAHMPPSQQYTQQKAPQTQFPSDTQVQTQAQTQAPAQSQEAELPARFPFSPVSSNVPTPPSLRARIKEKMNEEDALDEFERFADDGAKDAGADCTVEVESVEAAEQQPPAPVEEEEEEPEVDVDELTRRFAQLEAEAAAKVREFATDIISHACELAHAVSATYFAALQRTSVALAAGAADIRKEEEVQRATMARLDEYLKFMEEAKKMFGGGD